MKGNLVQKLSSTQRTSQPIVQTMWDCTSETSAVKQWANDLNRIVNANFKLAEISLAGRGVLLQHDDIYSIEEYARFAADQAGLNFFLVTNDIILSIEDWFKSIPKDQPTLVYLDPGIWLSKGLAEDEENEWPQLPEFDEAKASSFRKELASKLFSNSKHYKFFLVTGIQSHNQVDPSLRKAGLFDRRIILPDLDYDSKASLFFKNIGANKLDTTITSDRKRLGCMIHHEFPRKRQRDLFFQAVKRLAWRTKRKVTYQDLVIFAAYGTSEADVSVDPPMLRYRHAVHEAGHALLVHLDSREKLPPEYSSVIKRGNTLGIVVRRYEDHERISNDLSYCDIVHKIRVLLAGRAAEYLLLGVNEISANGASGDLEKATHLAGQLFGYQGHSPDLSTDIAAGSNLAVCLGKPSPSEYLHVENLYRPFLNQQFQLVLEMLRKNQGYLESIALELNEKTILLRDDFLNIYKNS